MQTQKQMYYAAVRRSTEASLTFLDMVKDGMTRTELAALIEKRPHVYGRFSGFLEKLPEDAALGRMSVVSA